MSDVNAGGRAWLTALPYLVLVLLLGMPVVVPRVFEPVVRDDPERNIDIPDELLIPRYFKAAYNEETMLFRFELPTAEPSWYHDYWIYEGDCHWRRQGRSPMGREPKLIYEDRITFFVDDGRVPEFGKYGGFVTASTEAMRFFTQEASAEEVRAIPRLSGQSDLRKWLPETRTDPHDWRSLKPDEELDALQQAGYFLDLWHWRAHRSNPIGWSDDQYILDYRWSDEGRGPFATNWDDEQQRPAYMFDPEKTGQHAMRLELIEEQAYGQDDYLRYALIRGTEEIEGNTVPFDPERDWSPGDVIPRRLLQVPEGSRGAIRANGIYRDGSWHVDLWRALDTGNPLDDKALQHGGLYQVAFAAHILATGSRWHYVSFPFTLGLGREAQINARRFEGDAPPWDEMDWFEMKLFYPGQIDWAHLISDGHAGADAMADGVPLPVGHDEEIRRQWALTTLGKAGLMALLAAALVVGLARREDEPAGAPATNEHHLN